MEKGRVTHSPLFLVRTLRDTKGVKFAAVAPKKIEKTAVGRNRARRLIYTAIAELYKDIKIDLEAESTTKDSGGTHAIIFIKPSNGNIDQVAMISDLKQLFVKAGILK